MNEIKIYHRASVLNQVPCIELIHLRAELRPVKLYGFN